MIKGPRKKQPVTAARVEAALDTLAWIMSKSRNANLLVPIWKRLEGELERLKDEEAVVAAARARVAARLQRAGNPVSG
jgi:hypothetical protein